MTLETRKRLLEHYENVGNKKAADNMRQHMKDLGDSLEEPVKESPKKKKKSLKDMAKDILG